jgi:hypothetical protein
MRHILALLPTRNRFHAALACRALARAVRPPSEVWADIMLTERQLHKPAAVACLLPSLRLAGHSLKRLDFAFTQPWLNTSAVASLRSILEVAVPHLETLMLIAPFAAGEIFLRSAHDALASASRLTRLDIVNHFTIVAPCRLPGWAWAAAATDEFVVEFPGNRLRQAAMIAAAAAPAGARLAKIDGLTSLSADHVEACNALAAVAGAGLTHLSLTLSPWANELPALASLVARLPALVELDISRDRSTSETDDLDLTALTSPSLERLAVFYGNLSGVADATAARLGELVLKALASHDPPAVFEGGGGSRFARLTRLEYQPRFTSACVDLGPWSDADFSIPTLVELTVEGWSFTLGGRDGRVWATAVARETLPRLARLELLDLGESSRNPGVLKYACRAGPLEWDHGPRDRPVCVFCRAQGGCAGGREVERALWEALPAAAADAGRRLVVSDRRRTANRFVVFHTSNSFERQLWWLSKYELTLHFEAAPPEG